MMIIVTNEVRENNFSSQFVKLDTVTDIHMREDLKNRFNLEPNFPEFQEIYYFTV